VIIMHARVKDVLSVFSRPDEQIRREITPDRFAYPVDHD
jgi:hypothetical protein